MWNCFTFISPLYRHDTDDEVATAKRSRDVDALRRRKHKKNKKHKKSSKYDKATKEHSKKHKKVKRKAKSESESSAGTSDSSEKIVITNETAASTTATSLSSKFAEIMKTNGHTTGTVIPPKLMRKPKIPTDPSKLVEMITQSLDQTEPSLEIVSSESDSDGGQIPVDVDSPDVAVIEDELNLEELMKQKALLQARLGVITSDTDEEEPPVADVGKVAAEKIDKTANDVILLVDDSSGEAIRAKIKAAAPKRVAKRSRSRSREKKRAATASSNAMPPADTRAARAEGGQMVRDRYGGRGEYEQRFRNKRNDNDNRFKEDLRREIDRDKERSFREREQRRRDGGPLQERPHPAGGQDRSFGRAGRGYSADRRQSGGQRSRSRERGGDQHDRAYGSRYRRRGEEKKDKFVGSLSEGQKPDKESSSDSDVGNINVNDDDDDDEKIIEQRRKKREELLKVSGHKHVSEKISENVVILFILFFLYRNWQPIRPKVTHFQRVQRLLSIRRPMTMLLCCRHRRMQKSCHQNQYRYPLLRRHQFRRQFRCRQYLNL